MSNSNIKLFCFCLTLSLFGLFTMPIMARYPDFSGYWNFNGNTSDLSGNDSNGIVTGTTTYDANGRVGKAFNFDGSTSIDCGINPSLSMADNISVELWLYPEQWVADYAAHPISKWSGTSDANYVMYFFGDTAGSYYKKIRFLANVGGTWTAVSPLYLIPTLNTWYHIVWTYSSTDGGKLYINGTQYGSATGSGILATNTASLKIGKSGFTGLLDEVKIYNRALTAADVQKKNLDAQTRGYWNFHDNTLDFSDNDNMGTVVGNATYEAYGSVGKAFDFDGNTAIDCGNNPSLSIADNMSVELWFYPEQWVTGYATHPISKWTNTSDANYVMYFFGDTAGSFYKKIRFYANTEGTWIAVSPLYLIPALNTWYHIVWTYSSTDGGKLYINGTQYGSATGSGTLTTNTASLKIGKSSFTGLLDEVKIYDRVLSPSDITTSYQDLGIGGVVLENDTLKLTVSATGKITELLSKQTGQNYSQKTANFAQIKKDGVWYVSSSCLQKNGRLLINFGAANVTAEITTKSNGPYFVFQIYSVYGDTNDIEKLVLFNTYYSAFIYDDAMSGIKGDDVFSLVLRAMNARASVGQNLYLVGSVVSHPIYGLALAKFGLLGYPTNNIRSALKTMLTAEGLPRSTQGGPWALDAPENKYSYIFAFDITKNDVNSYINLAKATGSNIIDFYSWWTSIGNYAPKSTLYPNGLADMKTCVDAIHAAGLKASMHCLTGLISTDNSIYVTPLADTRLQKDALFTLASAIGTSDTTITVNEQPSAILDVTGKILQIGNELIRFTDYTQTTPYRFIGCTRGAYSTTKQSSSAGASVGHLPQSSSGYFRPDPDSTLVDEIADTLANVVNYCDFDMIYLDGADGGTVYERVKYGTAIFNRIKKSVRVETSNQDHGYWTFISNGGAWDYPTYGIKKFIDKHVLGVKDLYKKRLIPCQLGWWYFLGAGENYYSQLPDEVEYLCAKALGCDAGLSHESLSSSPKNGRQDEYMRIVKAYEDLRTAGAVPDTVKSQLKTAGREFHLTLGGNIIERDNPIHKITSLMDGSSGWVLNNRFSSQSAKFRIQALHSDLTVSYDNGPNISLTNFQNAGDFVLTNATNVTSSLSVNEGICTYMATNNGATPVGAWVKASKTFSPVLNISGGYDTLGVWVNGDGKGEILNFQLYLDTVYDDHYVEVNFIGWKYFELFLRERDAGKYDTYLWPYSGFYALYRNLIPRNNIPNLNIYYNNLPVGQQVNCQIKPVKALLTKSINISNPSITINGKKIIFPVTLQSGQYIEFYSMQDCKLYSDNGTFISYITPTGYVPTLGVGNNNVTFNSVVITGYNTRAYVTMFIDGTQIYP